MYIYYYLHADSFVGKSNEAGTGNTKLQDQNTSVKKPYQEPNNLQDNSDSTYGNRRLPNATVNESNRQTVHQNGNLRGDDCEEDIGPHFGKHYVLL